MKRARIYHKGAAVWAEVINGDQTLRLATGETLPVAGAHWLPPVTPGAAIFALVSAMVLPYAIVLPAAELLWLGAVKRPA